jgi:hypothetical protein
MSETATPPTQSAGIIGQLVEGYIKLRDRKAEIKAKHEAELAPINAMMDKIETHLLAQMQEQGVTSYKTGLGTAYTSTTTKANVADWDGLLGFVRENGLWQMLERRVSKTAVDEYVAAHQDLPPGVNYTTAISVNVRRS